MAHSLTPVSEAKLPPDGSFEHPASKSKFTIHSSGGVMTQSMTRPDETTEQTIGFVIGSGAHAFGFLTHVGDHVFQSPLSYYTQKQVWDMAPGYEADRFPDFSRPVTAECLFCHSGKALPVAESLNQYQPKVFSAHGITCERCHGDAASHLDLPAPGSILNPAKMFGAARASICEQCHLIGETRITNPNKSITDFKPGQALEDVYTTYIAAETSGKTVKVVSHSQQLALSKCAIKSGEKLWCGTCHNPHAEPEQPVAYYRDKCLTCHAATLDKAHQAPDRDCVSCHMPKAPAKDGGHSAFTNHKIMRNPATEPEPAKADTLTAWREPDPYVKDRNLSLALIANGLETRSSAEAIQGYKILSKMPKDFPNDPVVYSVLGTVLLQAKIPDEALKCFKRLVALKPTYASYRVNLATAYLELKQPDQAVAELEKARSLDPLLQAPVQLLHELYHEMKQEDKSKAVLAEYDKAMGSLHQ